MNIRKILFWIFFILSVIFFIWYFVGDSPTLEQGLLLFMLVTVIQVGYSIRDNKYLINNLINKVGKLEMRMDKLEK